MFKKPSKLPGLPIRLPDIPLLPGFPVKKKRKPSPVPQRKRRVPFDKYKKRK